MTTITVCDRCNKPLPKDTDNEIIFTAKRNSRYGYDKRINLCTKCMVLFEKFLSQKKKKGEVGL